MFWVIFLISFASSCLRILLPERISFQKSFACSSVKVLKWIKTTVFKIQHHFFKSIFVSLCYAVYKKKRVVSAPSFTRTYKKRRGASNNVSKCLARRRHSSYDHCARWTFSSCRTMLFGCSSEQIFSYKWNTFGISFCCRARRRCYWSLWSCVYSCTTLWHVMCWNKKQASSTERVYLSRIFYGIAWKTNCSVFFNTIRAAFV